MFVALHHHHHQSSLTCTPQLKYEIRIKHFETFSMIPVAFLQTGLSLHYFGLGIKKYNALEQSIEL